MRINNIMFKQKKYKIIISEIVTLIITFEILNYYFQVFQNWWISNIYLVALGISFWTFLWFLKKEDLKLVARIIVNFLFILVSIAYPVVFILSLVGVA